MVIYDYFRWAFNSIQSCLFFKSVIIFNKTNEETLIAI